MFITLSSYPFVLKAFICSFASHCLSKLQNPWPNKIIDFILKVCILKDSKKRKTVKLNWNDETDGLLTYLIQRCLLQFIFGYFEFILQVHQLLTLQRRGINPLILPNWHKPYVFMYLYFNYIILYSRSHRDAYV